MGIVEQSCLTNAELSHVTEHLFWKERSPWCDLTNVAASAPKHEGFDDEFLEVLKGWEREWKPSRNDVAI